VLSSRFFGKDACAAEWDRKVIAAKPRALESFARCFRPRPGQPTKPVVLVEDNGPIHTSKLSTAALATRAHWLTVEWLPKYAPELNDIEVVWRDLKAHHLAHQIFADIDALDRAIHQAVDKLNTERAMLRWPS
jgi:transposase